MLARSCSVTITAAVLGWFLALAGGYKISATNTSEYTSNKRWEWTVFLVATADVLAHIKCVEYTLHPTFPNPVRLVCEKGSDSQPFYLKGEGWGEFSMPITVTFDDGSTQTFAYELKLRASKETQEGIQKGTPQSACGTQVDFFTLTTKKVHRLPVPYDSIYVGSEHVYDHIVSAFLDVIYTHESIGIDDYNWKRFHNQFPQVKEIQKGALSLEEARRMIDVSAKHPLTVSIVNTQPLSFFVEQADAPKSIKVRACAP